MLALCGRLLSVGPAGHAACHSARMMTPYSHKDFPELTPIIGRTYFRDYQMRSSEIIGKSRISRNLPPPVDSPTSVDLYKSNGFRGDSFENPRSWG